MGLRYNPPPGWPSAPEGFSPEPGWRPDPSWPSPPPGWQLWVSDDQPAAYSSYDQGSYGSGSAQAPGRGYLAGNSYDEAGSDGTEESRTRHLQGGSGDTSRYGGTAYGDAAPGAPDNTFRFRPGSDASGYGGADSRPGSEAGGYGGYGGPGSQYADTGAGAGGQYAGAGTPGGPYSGTAGSQYADPGPAGAQYGGSGTAGSQYGGSGPAGGQYGGAGTAGGAYGSPYAAPGSPYGGPGGPGGPYGGQPPQRTTTSGFAIASLILGIIGGAVLSAIFGFVALAKIKRTGQRGRGMAVAGIVLSGAWVIIIVAIIISAQGQASRGTNGQINKGGNLSVFSLSVGDCFSNPNSQQDIASVTAEPCTQAHDAQVFAKFNVNGSDANYPTNFTSLASNGCNADLNRLNQSLVNNSMSIRFIYPDQQAWAAGQRTVNCLVVSPTNISTSLLNS